MDECASWIDRIWAVTAGEASNEARQAVLTHAADCDVCRLALASALEPSVAVPTVLAADARKEKGMSSFSAVFRKCTYPLFRSRLTKSAAALLLAVGGVYAIVSWTTGVWQPSFLGARASRPHSGEEEETSAFLLRPGVRLVPGPAAQWSESRNSDADLRLDRGTLSVRVEPGASGVRIQTPLGVVRDIGTEFRLTIRSYRPYGEEEGKERATGSNGRRSLAGWVDVTEGSVEWTAQEGRSTVPAFMRGYVSEGNPVLLQSLQQKTDLRTRLNAFRNALAQKDIQQIRSLEAILLAESAGREEELKRLAEDPEYRTLCEWLLSSLPPSPSGVLSRGRRPRQSIQPSLQSSASEASGKGEGGEGSFVE